jgi:prophage regulatory protein
MTDAPRLIRLPEVLRRTGLSRSTLYAKMKVDEFPQAVSLGPSMSAWVDSEVTSWIAARISARDAAAPSAPNASAAA